MDGDIVGVRIIPPVIEFYDAEPVTIHCQNITVQNISANSKQVKFHGPDSQEFKLLVDNPIKPIAPGLEVTATVEFCTEETRDYQDRIILQVDEDVIEIPLCAYTPQPLLVVEGLVDFGNVVRDCKVLSREVTIANHGSLPGSFTISYTGKAPVTVSPTKGTLKPNTAQNIKVEFVTKYAGVLSEAAEVQLEGQEPAVLAIKATVVDRSLQLLSPKDGEPIECITFGSTYYGTDRTQAAILFNNSPDVVNFVTVLDEEAEGMELGADLTKSATHIIATKDTLAGARGCSSGLTSLLTAIPNQGIHAPHGADLTKSTTHAIATKGTSVAARGCSSGLTSLMTALPNQGVLGPHERVPVFFRFSPRYSSSKQGWKGTSVALPRQDYALFMHITTVGSSSGVCGESQDLEAFKLEVALTGTALPVLLSISPQASFHFNECPVNEHVDTLATLTNDSQVLPALFAFKPVAQFVVHPPSGRLKPGESRDLMISFKPNQYGNFRLLQLMEVLGSVAAQEGGVASPLDTLQEPIHTMHVLLTGQGISSTKKKEPKFNPGITPQVVGEVGQCVEVKVDQMRAYEPRAAVLGAPRSRDLHTTRTTGHSRDAEALVAYPNDRARSVRPSNRREQYKTIFTKTDRHTYVDDDYGYNDEEMKEIQEHKDKYDAYIKELRAKRINKTKSREFIELNNNTDIGIKPASGLRPPKLSSRDVKPYLSSPVPPENNNQMLSSKRLQERERQTRVRPSSGGLNAVPMTTAEKADCKRRLSPQELHQVIIGPASVDFGKVCLKSTSTQMVNIVNCLNQCVHVVMEIYSKELRQSSPLSQVVPPNTKTQLPLVFESNIKGKFQRNVTYTVNSHHKDHIIVYADVVPVALELSSESVLLMPTPGLPAEAGLRGVVTLRNRRNYPAEFTWQPILGERGTAFSIRPATGVVEAVQDLECEVVFHPSYHAPGEGEFLVQVSGGDPLKLKCRADLGSTQVMFMERRVLFGQVPLHLTTTRTALLHNHSQNHAFFQIIDPNPVPGLLVSPIQGVVPVGGTTELQIDLTPTAVMKFDTRLEVDIRGWRTIELRMGGTVEPPSVDIDVPSFQLGGVYCGSTVTAPFKMVNKGKTKAKVVFDLSRYRDFSIKFDGDVMEEFEDSSNPGVYYATIQGSTTMRSWLEFSPTEVAAYDFTIPVSINQTEAPTPDSTPVPPTPAPSIKSIQHIISPRPVVVTVATPKRRIVATALRQPLEVSHHSLEFSLPSGYLDLGVMGGNAQCKGTLFINNSSKALQWSLDTQGCGSALDEGVFQFVSSKGVPYLSPREGGSSVSDSLEPGETYSLAVKFCPMLPGEYHARAPIILNGNRDRPYQYLHLYGILHSPKLTFDPLAIVMTPVPLLTCTTANLTIQAHGFTSRSVIDVELPEVEATDGSRLTVLDVTFLEGQTIAPLAPGEDDEEPILLQCQINFSSPKPVSFTKDLKFMDSAGNCFSIPVTATADNCLLTAYPFVAQHRLDFQIVTQQGRVLRGLQSESKESLNGGGEAVIMPLESSPRPPTHSSSTSSRFGVTSSTYEDSDTLTVSTYPSTPRDGAVNRATRGVDSQIDVFAGGIASRSLGSAVFPDEESEEGIFHQEVLTAIQRWVTLHGWPGGPFPVLVPEGLRSGVSKGSAADAAQSRTSKGPTTNNQKKNYTKTIYDLLAHLSGRAVPGIPVNQALPSDPIERVRQLHWQHTTMMTFLRAQGASIAHIKPEFLFEPRDYHRWTALQQRDNGEKRLKADPGLTSTPSASSEDTLLDGALFELVSKRAWTDLLLQTLKVLVLARLTPRQYKNLPAPGGQPLPSINPDPLCSNIYCVGERILLSWLNHHYEAQRHKIWQDAEKGGVPASRWVVNFDYDLLDGLVLGALLAAHVPFLTTSHLGGMYTQPSTAEQCLHNALKVVTAFRCIGLDYDIQAIDITDPNPISLLLLCVHLYQRLPQYTPKTSVEFVGALHETVLRQVQLSNPSTKPLVYQAIIAGGDARDFTLPQGETITIPPKSKHDLRINFTSRFLRPASAVLVLVGRRAGAATGTTLVFNLRTLVDDLQPMEVEGEDLPGMCTMLIFNVKTAIDEYSFRLWSWQSLSLFQQRLMSTLRQVLELMGVVKSESPCYQLRTIDLSITNPFKEAGDFKVVLAETALLDRKSPSNTSPKKSGTQPRKVRSKIDNGRRREETPSHSKPEDVTSEFEDASEKSSQVTSFYLNAKTVHLEAEGSATISVDFLPFYLGKFTCSVLVVSEDIGEFFYTIEATSVLPVPSPLPYVPSKHNMRIRSGTVNGDDHAAYDDSDRVIHWHCDGNAVLKEQLLVPVTNMAKERALVIAAQKGMSAAEIRRRDVTNTLTSSTVTAAIAKVKLSSDSDRGDLDSVEDDTTFQVELTSKYFHAPSVLYMPSINAERTQSEADLANRAKGRRSPPHLDKQTGIVMDPGSAALPIKFTPEGGGQYPCQVILRSPHDVRVYQIVCSVDPEGSTTQIEFVAPVHQSVSQDIPIINYSDADWYLDCNIDGLGFYGPSEIVAEQGRTTTYPLMFRPSLESLTTGRLTMVNQDDGTEHHFVLKGEAQKPLALDHILVECNAGDKIERVLKVPNVTSSKMTFRAVSDLQILSGPHSVTVLPGKEADYPILISPWRRGAFKGLLTFIAGGTTNLRDGSADHGGTKSRPSSVKSTTSTAASNGSITDKSPGYRVWYSVEVQSSPAPAQRTINITSCAQSAALVEVEVCNPLTQTLILEVIIQGSGLRGDPEVKLAPGERRMYQLVFAPSSVGATHGSLVFQNPSLGEFWYELNLVAEMPAPTVCPPMECELGKWSRQFITLSNPTEETLVLVPTNSNSNNFTLEIEQDKPVVLAPHSNLEVPVQFMPSALGAGSHTAVISFSCEQLGDWQFHLSGVGLTPTPVDPVSISAILGSNTALILPFRNPTDEQVLVDVILTDNTNLSSAAHDQLKRNHIQTESAFCILLKHSSNIPVAPKATLEIPLTFAPGDMSLHEALCVVSVRREDGLKWESVLPMKAEHPHDVNRDSTTNGLKDIRWLYPVHGIPESHPKTGRGAVVSCQARSRIEERLEVTLTGAVASSSGSHTNIRTRAVTPKDSQRTPTDGVVVGEGNAIATELSHELLFGDEGARSSLEHSTSISLVRRTRDPLTGIVTLVFNVIFSPFKVMKHDVELCVTSATGGVWRFPLRFCSTEPPVDDTIMIESIGLNKEASVGFRLTSHAKHPVPFNAYFVAGSDLGFTVTPQSGELLPQGTKGTLVTIGFTPRIYGKTYKAKLVVQTAEMQWTYNIIGDIPEYITPTGKSDRPISGPHQGSAKKGRGRNFILENLQLTTTAVSSPIKGTPVITKN